MATDTAHLVVATLETRWAEDKTRVSDESESCRVRWNHQKRGSTHGNQQGVVVNTDGSKEAQSVGPQAPG
jgi:hypothetical protein